MNNYYQIGKNEKLTRTSNRHPCPICGKTNGNCRTKDDSLILCMTIHEDKGTQVSGFKSIGPTSDGLWTRYVPDTHDGYRDNSRLEACRREREQREQAERDRLAKGLSESERDRYFRQVGELMGLLPHHADDLRRRDFDPELAKVLGFFSIRSDRTIPHQIDGRLPGIRKVGQWQYFGPYNIDGYVCPAFNGKGEIIGGQIHSIGDPDRKYQWLKGDHSSHLNNGELPLSFIRGNLESEDLYLCEGFTKPLIASERHKINVLGSPGGNFSGSPNQVKEYIKGFKNPRPLIAADAGDILNHHVMNRWIRQYKFFKSLGIELAVKWWGQTTKEHDDIDELNSLENTRIISFEEFLELGRIKPKTIRKVTKKRLKGFKLADVTSFFNREDRSKQWLSDKYKNAVLVDSSYCGDGKSHAVPELDNPHGNIYYINKGHRNPSIKGIEDNYTDLVPRSRWGFYRNDEGKLIEANADIPSHRLEVGPNCHRSDEFKLLKNLGYNPDKKGEQSTDGELVEDNPICATCNARFICGIMPGYYKYERKEALKSKRIRADISSLPRDADYSHHWIQIDELSSLSPSSVVSTKYDQLILNQDRVRDFIDPFEHQYIDGILQQFKLIFQEKKGIYGVEHEEILERVKLPESEVNLDDLIDKLSQVPLPLTEETLQDADTVKGSELKKNKDDQRFRSALETANKLIRSENRKETKEALESVPPNAILHLLKALRKDKDVSLRIDYFGELAITIDNREQWLPIFKQAERIIISDASASEEKIRLYLGDIGKPIHFIKSKKDDPLKNVIHNQIIFEKGMNSNRYSDSHLDRIDNTLEILYKQIGYKPPIIGHKAHKERLGLSGYWGKDNRGSNDFCDSESLILIGIPYVNYGALKDQYRVLNGSLEGFENYYQHVVNEEIFQAIFRQRADRNPNKKFYIYHLVPDNVDLSWIADHGAKINRMPATMLGSQCAGGTDKTLLTAIEAVRDYGLSSIRAIAKKLDKSHEAIAKVFRQAGITIEAIKDRLSHLTVNFPYKGEVYKKLTPDPLVEAFRDLLNATDSDLLELVVDYLIHLSWDEFLSLVLSEWPKALQDKALRLIKAFIEIDPPPDPEPGG